MVVACDGGGSVVRHPKVYINLDRENKMGMSGNYDLQFKRHHHHFGLHPCPVSPAEHLHIRCINVRLWLLCVKRCPSS